MDENQGRKGRVSHSDMPTKTLKTEKGRWTAIDNNRFITHESKKKNTNTSKNETKKKFHAADFRNLT